MIGKSNEPLYKVRIYKDNRILITLHNFNSFQSIGPIPSTRNTTTPILTPKYMSYKDYKRLLNYTHRKLWERDFDQSKCVFITLTLDKDLDYSTLLKEFHRFYVYVKRKFGKLEYIRAIELQEKNLRYHIHLVIQFQEYPTLINKSIIENLWGLGICDFQPVTKIRGVLQYLTIIKDHHIQKENPHFTYFLRGSKLISTSQNFGVQIDSDSYRDDYVTADHLKFILDYHFDKFFDNKGEFVRVDEHQFYNLNKGEMDNCMDRVFIRTTKEFIDSNFIDLLSDENKPP